MMKTSASCTQLRHTRQQPGYQQNIRVANVLTMKYKTIATAASILTFINAIFFLFLPDMSLSFLGRSTNLVGIMSTRISGACALGISYITWSSRNTKTLEVQKIVTNGNLIMFGILILVDLYGVVWNVINDLGWLILLADLLIFYSFIMSFSTFRGSK